ncbi:MAG: sulfurtransferase [Rhodoferax sp.]|nr:sulfurtransferase [Rhodoferax sp.]
MPYTTLISPSELLALQAASQPCVVYDCSFDLMNPHAGDAQFTEGHIPGAVRADLDRHLSHPGGQPGAASGGRHPLPDRKAFAAWIGGTGLLPGMQAVVYDRQGVNYCGRLWWMLKWLGHEDVAVLDGGWQGWLAAGGASAPGAPTAADSGKNYPETLARAELVATQTVAERLGRPVQTLIDARAPARFRGEVEPLDPVAGHIPGALNRPFSANLGSDGRFKPAAQLREEFETLLAGRQPATVVHHCGSGVSAIPNLLAMEIAGLGRAGLYAGSWSEWCRDPSRPCAQG